MHAKSEVYSFNRFAEIVH